jgi:hypothetical protein
VVEILDRKITDPTPVVSKNADFFKKRRTASFFIRQLSGEDFLDWLHLS